jgi:hypothetical protein
MHRQYGWNAVRARASNALISGNGLALAGDRFNRTVRLLLFSAIAGGLFWLVWIYGNGLRDPRYLDGWVLAGGMALQVSFHIAKTAGLPPKSAARWRRVHIFAGYLVIAAFISHSDFTLPDTGFEWALWAGFVLVTLSGILGTYLVWSQRAKGRIDEGISYDRLPALRAELKCAFLVAVAETDAPAAAIDLPGLPHDAWIMELHTTHLADFFEGPRNFTGHLIGSQRPLRRLTDAIDNLSRYVDRQSQAKLATVRQLVIEKDRLDCARVSLGLSRGWLFVHVPVTYALIVLTVAHILVVYAFSSGFW